MNKHWSEIGIKKMNDLNKYQEIKKLIDEWNKLGIDENCLMWNWDKINNDYFFKIMAVINK